MARLQFSRAVKAPAHAVFEYVDVHANYHWMFRSPQLKWKTERHKVGTSLKMELRLAGVPVLVEFETTEVVPDAKLAGVITSGGGGRWEWRFESHGAATAVTLVVEYRLPAGILGRLADRIAVERGLRADLEWTMDYIKKMMESQSCAA